MLDPTVNSIGHFFVFDILYSDPHGAHSIGPESELHDRFIEFLVTFDAVQMRYVVAPLLSLLDRILRCGPFPVRRPCAGPASLIETNGRPQACRCH